jgi:tetraacyldisaccharide 4'-kinase
LDIQAFWSRKGPLNFLLLPLSLLFGAAAALRRWAYRTGLLRSGHPGVPVMVVGNLTVGGSGKTPFVIWLVEWLKSQGRHPGVVSRGYGRRDRGMRCVGGGSMAAEVGDEPLLVHQKTGVPVVVGADRLAAARWLHAQYPGVDVIVADDGLQHYRLQRDMELVLADAGALFGNGWLLPAGPLREPLARLGRADALILSQRNKTSADIRAAVPVFSIRHAPAGFRNVADNSLAAVLPASHGKAWQAVTGIARPENFFAMLAGLGVDHQPRAYPDHHLFAASELDPEAPVVMTEKDAVKCVKLAGMNWWALQLGLVPSPGLHDWLADKLPRLFINTTTSHDHLAEKETQHGKR